MKFYIVLRVSGRTALASDKIPKQFEGFHRPPRALRQPRPKSFAKQKRHGSHSTKYDHSAKLSHLFCSTFMFNRPAPGSHPATLSSYGQHIRVNAAKPQVSSEVSQSVNIKITIASVTQLKPKLRSVTYSA